MSNDFEEREEQELYAEGNYRIFEDTNFSQLLTESTRVQEVKRDLRRKPHSQPLAVDQAEEAFTVLKSIQSVHSPLSCTAAIAYLHHRRGINVDRRTVDGLTWPEHPQSFDKSRLISGQEDLGLDSGGVVKLIPKFYSSDSEDADCYPCDPCESTVTSTSTSNSTSTDTSASSLPLCEMTSNSRLHAALIRTCQSIYRKRIRIQSKNKQHQQASSEIDPHLSHVIARKCSFLLQSLFSRSLLTRRSALKILLRQQPDKLCQPQNMDFDNVPVNWEDTREAARQLVGQAALEHENFLNFLARLNRTFARK